MSGSIPIKNINSGDTISTMVDKINYNFDLISLKNGGPAGVQGVQGIRGEIGDKGEQGIQGIKGTGFIIDEEIHGGDPAAEYNIGDIALSTDGVFYIVDENYKWVIYSDFILQLDSAFKVDDDIIKYRNGVKPLLLGATDEDSEVESSLIYLKGDVGTTYEAYLDGYDGVVLTKSLSERDGDKCLNLTLSDDNSLYINGSIKLEGLTDATSNLKELTAVEENTNNVILTGWQIDQNGVLYKNYGKIGKESTGEIDEIFLTYQGKIKSRQNIELNINNIPTAVIHKNGMTLGGYSGLGLNANEFGLRISNPLSNSIYSPYIALNSLSSSEIDTVNFNNSLTSNASYLINTSKNVTNLILSNLQTPIVTVSGESNAKQISKTLKISGASINRSSNGVGQNVVIQGGNAKGGSQSTGGDVYITGGELFQKKNDANITGSLTGAGNVVIGLNPTTQKFNFDDAEDVTSTNPEGVNYFPIKNVAVHGERIVVDSGANWRKQNSQATSPYAEVPQNTTLQLSGINTLYTQSPIILSSTDDIFNYQLLSGVMRQNYVIHYDSNTSKFTVNQITDEALQDTYISINDDSHHDLIYMVYQVWQKVGNVVNAQLRSEWYFYNNTVTQDRGLYHLYATPTSGQYTNSTLTRIINNSPSIQTIVELPISVSGQRCMWVAGEGGVFTELNSSTSSSDWLTTTQPLYVGNEHISQNNEIIYTGSTANSYHNNTTFKKQTRFLYGTSFLAEDERLYHEVPTTYSGSWDENRYIKTSNSYKDINNSINYIFPTILYKDSSTTKIRPILKPYTSMLLNYSYILGNQFNDLYNKYYPSLKSGIYTPSSTEAIPSVNVTTIDSNTNYNTSHVD